MSVVGSVKATNTKVNIFTCSFLVSVFSCFCVSFCQKVNLNCSACTILLSTTVTKDLYSSAKAITVLQYAILAVAVKMSVLATSTY